tara:strand:+ start:663 stop:1076 length:414 start_codon:yes stop_codon:yes gene_type:complete
MEIVIDSNILFSALIKDSITRKMIIEYNDLFLFPDYIFVEINNHLDELLDKSEMDKQDFQMLLEIILRKVQVVPSKVLTRYKKQALRIIKDVDPDDVLFIACALAYPKVVIWSDDKKLKKQSRIKVLNTKEVIDLFD